MLQMLLILNVGCNILQIEFYFSVEHPSYKLFVLHNTLDSVEFLFFFDLFGKFAVLNYDILSLFLNSCAFLLDCLDDFLTHTHVFNMVISKLLL